MAVHGYQHHLHHSHSHGHASQNTSLTEGSIVKGLIGFAVPLFLGQLLQQLYNMADAWVVGNFAENDAFAAVSSGGSLTFLMIGFFNGIAIGGGVVGDIAGFAAAVYQRGIRFILLPTTFLAAVDSSIGGKTAIDLKAGKNLAGAFYQPHLVLCDTDTLETLPPEIFADGIAETLKYGILGNRELFEKILN